MRRATRPASLFALLLAVVMAQDSPPALALPPATDIGPEWAVGALRFLAVGDITTDPGLECIAMDDLGAIGLYRLDAGSRLAQLPSNIAPSTRFHMFDVDDDGLAEVFYVNDDLLTVAELGMLDADRGMRDMWPPLQLPGGADGVDVMNLNAAEPHALVVQGAAVVIVSPQAGVVLYDSANDAGLGSGFVATGLLIDDFDSDGRDELLLTMVQQSDQRIALIGDRAVGASGVETPAVGGVRLRQNSPNPFNGGTEIRYEMERPGRARLRIYDTAGRLVRTLVDGHGTAGAHTQQWNGRDDDGQDVASGIYIYELDVDGRRQTRKLVQVR